MKNLFLEKNNIFKNLYLLICLVCVITGCGSSVSGGGSASNALTATCSYDSDQAIIYSSGWDGNTPINLSLSTEIQTAYGTNVGLLGGGSVTYTEIYSQITSALATWESALNVTPGTIFQIVNTTTLSGTNNLTSLYAPLNYSLNGIFYDFNFLNNTQLPSSTAAVTVLDATNNGVIVKASVRFNNQSYAFGDVLNDESTLGGMQLIDLQSVALHEFGHVLGLGHVPAEPGSVMYPSIDTYTAKRTLSTNDIARINSIY
jgi:hypothetical protein